MKKLIILLVVLLSAGCGQTAALEQDLPDHTHEPVSKAALIDEPVTLFCGNTLTELYIDGQQYTLWSSDSIAISTILMNARYDEEICDCDVEYQARTEFGDKYGINLTQAFIRKGQGQCSLTEEQVGTIRTVLERIENNEASIYGS